MEITCGFNFHNHRSNSYEEFGPPFQAAASTTTNSDG
jgi:hypothetical protein